MGGLSGLSPVTVARSFSASLRPPGGHHLTVRQQARGALTHSDTGVTGADSIAIDVATSGVGAAAGTVVNTGIVNSTATNAAAVPSFAAVRVINTGTAPVTVNATGNVTAAAGSGIWAQFSEILCLLSRLQIPLSTYRFASK